MSIPASIVAETPVNEHSRAIHEANLYPVPRRNDDAFGAGRDSTSFVLTLSSDSSGACGMNRRMMSIVWSMNAVC